MQRDILNLMRAAAEGKLPLIAVLEGRAMKSALHYDVENQTAQMVRPSYSRALRGAFHSRRARPLRDALSFQNYIKTMRTRSLILIPAAVALFSSAGPASARYTEQWISNAAVTHTGQRSVALQKSKTATHRPAVQTAVDDDPIAAFARKPVRR